jgi:Zn-dependent peptidase ImmA (M78 family)/transcriptional regulator with XRE-family HTH domain
MTFTPSRLRHARERRGLTKTTLAREAGISLRSLKEYELGDRPPGPAAVAALAKTLNVPEEFLAADDLDALPVGAASFRALSKTSASRRDMALAVGRAVIEVDVWISQHFELPSADVPTLEVGHDDPENAARVVRERWGMGEAPVTNMVHALEAHGVRVFSLPEEIAEVDGFSLWWGGTPYVLLNPRKSGERGRFDAAHELGHLVMHAQHDLPAGRERETAANRFAAAFLMPRSSVLSAGLQHATVDRILSGRSYWKVAAVALTHRLRELGLLTEWEYTNRIVTLSRLGYRSGEPGGVPRETSLLLAKVLHALRQERLGAAGLAQRLRMSPEDLNAYLFGLTPTVLGGAGAGGTSNAPRLTVLPGGRSGPET